MTATPSENRLHPLPNTKHLCINVLESTDPRKTTAATTTRSWRRIHQTSSLHSSLDVSEIDKEKGDVKIERKFSFARRKRKEEAKFLLFCLILCITILVVFELLSVAQWVAVIEITPTRCEHRSLLTLLSHQRLLLLMAMHSNVRSFLHIFERDPHSFPSLSLSLSLSLYNIHSFSLTLLHAYSHSLSYNIPHSLSHSNSLSQYLSYYFFHSLTTSLTVFPTQTHFHNLFLTTSFSLLQHPVRVFLTQTHFHILFLTASFSRSLSPFLNI